jgi:site-specific DNA-methyltransferase (adenine-specific)
MIDIRLGRWQDTLADVEHIDSVITDPPYGARTHRGHDAAIEQITSATGQKTRNQIGYHAFTPRMVEELVGELCPRVTGWWCAMTSHDLLPSWESALEAQNMYTFAPLPIIQKRPRLLGDGPASWAVWMVVARRRNRDIARWSCLPGMYEGPTVKSGGVTGAKPLDMMRAIVRDYTRPGWLVVDPFAGSGTTLLAAAMEGRTSIGCEVDPATHAIASQRLHREYQATLFP